MFVRALTLALLSTSLSIASLSASEEEKPSGPEARLIQATEEELQAYRLPSPTTLPAPESSSFFTAAGLGMIAASAADVATTEIGLARGLEEGNPLASGRSVRLIHHVVGPTAVWWTTEKLQRSGRTKLALSLRIALMAAYSYAAVHNAARTSQATPVR